jgi:hypothetical protein
MTEPHAFRWVPRQPNLTSGHRPAQLDFRPPL